MLNTLNDVVSRKAVQCAEQEKKAMAKKQKQGRKKPSVPGGRPTKVEIVRLARDAY